MLKSLRVDSSEHLKIVTKGVALFGCALFFVGLFVPSRVCLQVNATAVTVADLGRVNALDPAPDDCGKV
jgi:hypothetical protein